MSTTHGWIALSRDIRDSWIWEDPRKFQMWVAMVFMASWCNKTTIFMDKEVELKRGQFATSLRTLSSKLGCNRKTLTIFLNNLEKTEYISRETISNKITIITIKDYDKKYQSEMTKMLSKKLKKDALKSAKNSVENDTVLETNNPTICREDQSNGDRKVTTNKEYNNKKINSSSFSPREQNEKFFQEIRDSEVFWQDTAKGLSVQVEELKPLAEKFFGEMLTKSDYKTSLKEVEEHLFNWLRRALELGNQKKTKSTDKLNLNDTQKIKPASIDRRRGVDAPSTKSSIYSGRRFTPEPSD